MPPQVTVALQNRKVEAGGSYRFQVQVCALCGNTHDVLCDAVHVSIKCLKYMQRKR